MSILFSGDFHSDAEGELSFITKEALCKKYLSGRFEGIKYHIILGDGGFLWPGNEETDSSNFKALAERPFPILCVIGNHEPMLGMDNLPEIDIGLGETVWQVHPDPFVAYFKRGKVYTIDGFRFLALGGALSIDRAYRTRGLSWWPKEYWPEQEKEDVLELLETENNFDFVLSHTGPCRINRKLFGYQSPYSSKFQDEVAFLNDKIDFRIQCCGWWCGHWHKDICHCEPKTNRSYQYLYKSTKLLYRENGKIVIDNEDGASTACEH